MGCRISKKQNVEEVRRWEGGAFAALTAPKPLPSIHSQGYPMVKPCSCHHHSISWSLLADKAKPNGVMHRVPSACTSVLREHLNSAKYYRGENVPLSFNPEYEWIFIANSQRHDSRWRPIVFSASWDWTCSMRSKSSRIHGKKLLLSF